MIFAVFFVAACLAAPTVPNAALPLNSAKYVAWKGAQARHAQRAVVEARAVPLVAADLGASVGPLLSMTNAGQDTRSNPDLWNYYYFYARGGDVLDVDVCRISSIFDPAMQLNGPFATLPTSTGLFAPGGGLSFVAYSDDGSTPCTGVNSGPWSDPRFVGLTLPGTGLYVLAVYDYDGDAGAPREFRFTATINSAPLIVPAPTAFCAICRPAQSLVAPCGPAFDDWVATRGFPQLGANCAAPTASALSSYCGSTPVAVTYNFTAATPNDLGSVTFTTADSSCTCNYCYTFENFDLSNSFPLCWTSQATGAWRTFNDVGFFDTAPNSFGIDLNATPLAPFLYSFTTQPYTFVRSVFSFWLRTALGAKQLRLQWSTDGGASFINVPASAISGCPYNNRLDYWNGTQTCVVNVSIPAGCRVNLATGVAIQWRWFLMIPASMRRDERVFPPQAVVNPPAVSGFWIDSLRSCGDTFVCRVAGP